MAVARKTAGVPEKDPEGGLTAAGRKAFAARDGSHLKPGVTKADAEMSPEDMKRKGSWAVRFYGRAALPPLLDAKGQPTRFALSAHAWGEPVPKTEAEARKIAEKGRRLLERYASQGGTPAKKAPGRKSPAEKTTASTAPAKKAAAKEVPARKAAAKKATAKKASARKASAQKASAKEASAQKAAATPAAAKKRSAQKAT